MGLIGGAFGLGMILGPLIGGLLIGPDPLRPHYTLPALAAAGASALALLLALLTVRETRPDAPAASAACGSGAIRSAACPG